MFTCWKYFENATPDFGMIQIMAQFFGRLHPVLVHLPIGILILAFIFEILSLFPRYKKLGQSTQPTILIGALFSIGAAISGYLLSQEGGYDEKLLGVHRNSGIATAIFATLFYFFRRKSILSLNNKGKRKTARLMFFALLVLLLSFTGHLGGSMTHGEDYLFNFDPETDIVNPVLKVEPGADIDSVVLYTDVIEPILAARCYSCHSSKKQKGQLRLDQVQFIEKGSKNGPVIVAGIADSSALYGRLMLPLEHEDHMPPNEKLQPSSAEIALIQTWIQEGASFTSQVQHYGQIENIRTYVNTLLAQTLRKPLIPTEPVSAPPASALSALTSKGILVVPVSRESNYVSVSFVNAREEADGGLAILAPLRDQLVWLNMSRTAITDLGLQAIGELHRLTELNLNYTPINGGGLKSIARLVNLTSLNLVGTEVGDEDLQHLTALRNLKKLFLYQTKVTSDGFKAFSELMPSVEIDTGGYNLPQLPGDSIIVQHD
jgi:uncharacterized membrane protein